MTTPRNIVEAAQTYLALGYSHDFRVEAHEVRDLTTDRAVSLADIQVDAAFRFEVEPGSPDASNFYAITDRRNGAKGLVIDAFDLLGHADSSPMVLHLAKGRLDALDSDGDVPTRYGLRKVSKHEFDDDPQRYVLRIDFPDFPECPFGESFSMLGFDTFEQTYVWLATSILRDEELVRVPYQDLDVPDND